MGWGFGLGWKWVERKLLIPGAAIFLLPTSHKSPWGPSSTASAWTKGPSFFIYSNKIWQDIARRLTHAKLQLRLMWLWLLHSGNLSFFLPINFHLFLFTSPYALKKSLPVFPHILKFLLVFPHNLTNGETKARENLLSSLGVTEWSRIEPDRLSLKTHDFQQHSPPLSVLQTSTLSLLLQILPPPWIYLKMDSRGWSNGTMVGRLPCTRLTQDGVRSIPWRSIWHPPS